MKSEAYQKIEQMDDAEGRLGYEMMEVQSLDSENGEYCDSYEDIGLGLMSCINRHPDQFELIEEVVTSIFGYDFSSFLARIEEHRERYDSL